MVRTWLEWKRRGRSHPPLVKKLAFVLGRTRGRWLAAGPQMWGAGKGRMGTEGRKYAQILPVRFLLSQWHF